MNILDEGGVGRHLARKNHKKKSDRKLSSSCRHENSPELSYFFSFTNFTFVILPALYVMLEPQIWSYPLPIWRLSPFVLNVGIPNKEISTLNQSNTHKATTRTDLPRNHENKPFQELVNKDTTDGSYIAQSSQIHTRNQTSEKKNKQMRRKKTKGAKQENNQKVQYFIPRRTDDEIHELFHQKQRSIHPIGRKFSELPTNLRENNARKRRTKRERER